MTASSHQAPDSGAGRPLAGGRDISRREFCALSATLAAGLGLGSALPPALAAAIEKARPGFKRRGFYLHGCWVMNHPFAVRKWELGDFRNMFRLMHHLGFTTVMMWPTPECAPLPLSDEDATALKFYREVNAAAQEVGLECWTAYCANVNSSQEVRALPWADRSLYATTEIIKADGGPGTEEYLAHRRKIIEILNNADGLIVIDADPGGYPGAQPEEYLRILKNDQQAMNGKPVIPWIWGGWGRDHTKQPPPNGWYWSEPVEPHVRAELAAIKRDLPPPWELLAGRSHREGWANGRKNLELVDAAGLMPQSTIMCYEAIEFEPTPPTLLLQFHLIRDNLKVEAQFQGVARGVFGNAQQPVGVLPNMYFFARGAADPAYLDTPTDEVLRDLAREFGGDPALLVPAWKCLELPLDEIPADLAARLRASQLTSTAASWIPGGTAGYLSILAAQVNSRRRLLLAVSRPPADADAAAASLADGAHALYIWWEVHRYVGMGRKGDPFKWGFIHSSQVDVLRAHAQQCAAIGPAVPARAAERFAAAASLPPAQATALIEAIVKPKAA